MKNFAQSLLLAVVVPLAAYAQEDGSICVDLILKSLYDEINELRADLAASGAYTRIGTAASGYTTYYAYENGTQISVLGGAADITAVNTQIDAVATPPGAIKWSEGLALASNDLYTVWAGTPAEEYGSPAVDGSTTVSRAQSHGTYTDVILEYSIWVDAGTEGPTANDALTSILIGDGDADAEARNAILSSTYTTMGATIQREQASSGKWLINIVFAGGYTNNSDVSVCQPTQNFGTGICEPTTEDIQFFNQVNALRVAPTSSDAKIDAIVAAFSGNLATYDWNSSGTPAERGFLDGASYWSGAKTYLTSASAASALKWRGGLYQAVVEHTAAMKASSSISVTGSDGSTPATRAAKYGTGDVSEIVYGADYDYEIMVLALIAEGGAYRDGVFTSETHVVTKWETTFPDPQKKAVDLLFSSSFTVNAPYDTCQAAVTAATVVPTGAIAGLAYTFASVSIFAAALF